MHSTNSGRIALFSISSMLDLGFQQKRFNIKQERIRSTKSVDGLSTCIGACLCFDYLWKLAYLQEVANHTRRLSSCVGEFDLSNLSTNILHLRCNHTVLAPLPKLFVACRPPSLSCVERSTALTALSNEWIDRGTDKR